MSTRGIRNGKGQIMTIENGSIGVVKKMYYGTNLIFDPTSIPVAPVIPSDYIVATGGTITYSGNNKIHTFSTVESSSFTVTAVPSTNSTASLLVVAGGGGGGYGGGGGGGAGEYLYTTSASISVQTYTTVVGDGGAGQTSTAGAGGANGQNSLFGSFTLLGGGGGGEVNFNGISGGSGGGSGKDGALGGSKVGSWVGFAGGGAGGQGSSGGGGASEVGEAGGALETSGDGGDGLAVSISGTSTYYAGGGGGGTNSTTAGKNGTGGLGGGGNGALNNQIATAGTDGTGGGGGGGAYSDGVTNARYGKDGGSGIIIVSYPYKNVLTTNLQQWLDVTSGTEAGSLLDRSGNGRNATNNSLTYDGTNKWWTVGPGNTSWSKYIDTGYRLSNFATVSWTVEAWVNVNDVRNDDFVGMIHDRNDTRGTNTIELSVGGTSQAKPVGALVGSDGSEVTCFNSATTYQNQWVLLTMTYEANYSGTTDRMKLYGNGVLLDTGTGVLGNINNAANLRLFGGYISSTYYVGEGKFGSYRIYSAANTEAQILQNYNAEKAHYGL